MERKVLIFFVMIIVFSGFINNFLDFFSFNLSTLVVDLILLSLLIFVIKKKKSFVSNEYKHLLKFYVAIVVFSTFKLLLDTNSFDERLLGFRNYIVYSSLFFIVPNLKQKSEDIENVVIYWVISCSVICSFSIIQGLFYNYLPPILLTPKSDKLFTFFDSNLIRTNGLIGNPINFTGFAVLFLSVVYNLFLSYKRRIYLFYCLIGLIALYFTYSRVAYVGVAIILSFSYILNNEISLRKKLKQTLLISVVSLSILAVFYDKIVGSSNDIFIIQRLLGNEETTQSSNEEHLLDTYNASNAISDNLLLGVGLGTQGESAKGERIITDGSWFHFFLELGTPLSIIFILFILLNLRFVYKIVRTTSLKWLRSLGLAFISFTFFLLVVSFVNSIFIARVVYLQYWLLAGIIVAGYSLEIKRRAVMLQLED